MKLKTIQQIDKVELQQKKFDLILASSGFESRAINLLSVVELASSNKYCFSFKSFERNISRRKNDKFFRDKGFRSVAVAGDDHRSVFEWLNRFLTKQTKEVLTILIDYSCMTRVWYAAILDFLRHYESNSIHRIELYFSYSIANYSPPPKSSPSNVHVGPIKGFNNISAPNLPSALVLGLGYIPERAYGLKEYLDAAPFLFYTNSIEGNAFSLDVEQKNAQLISQVSRENIYTYPIKDIEHTFYLLLDLCKDLKNGYRIVLAPCGPKPFTLVCLLVAIYLDEIDVWRISAGDSEKPSDKTASGEIITACVVFDS
jgi:hypothetical protein